MRYDVRPYFSCLGETLNNLAEVGDVDASKKEQ
jgi:hypothetical protein